MKESRKMGWIIIILGVICLALSGWLIPHGYYMLSHKNSSEAKSDVRIDQNGNDSVNIGKVENSSVTVIQKNDNKESSNRQSVGIKIDGAKGVQLKDNIIKGFDAGIDARNVEDLNADNNKIIE